MIFFVVFWDLIVLSKFITVNSILMLHFINYFNDFAWLVCDVKFSDSARLKSSERLETARNLIKNLFESSFS